MFKLKQKITGQTGNDSTRDAKFLQVKYLSYFRITLEMPLINCKINLIITWSAIYFIIANGSANWFIIANAIDDQVSTFAITCTNLYVSVTTFSTQDNAKLLDQIKSGFNYTIKWNKYQSIATIQSRNQYLDYLIDPIFHGVNSIFVLSLENNVQQTSYKQYFLPTVEIKNYNVMIDYKNVIFICQ